MPMNTEIIPTLSAYITNEILKQPARKLSWDEPLISSGLIDSFSLVDLALFIEDNFDVHLDDTELTSETFDSLRQLAELIRQRQG